MCDGKLGWGVGWRGGGGGGGERVVGKGWEVGMEDGEEVIRTSGKRARVWEGAEGRGEMKWIFGGERGGLEEKDMEMKD